MNETAVRVCGWLRWKFQTSDRARWVMIFVPVAAVLLATTNYGPIFFIDGAAAFHPAWHLVHHGHLYVDDLPLRIFAFVEGRDGHLYSNRTPGLIAAALPAYLLWPFGNSPSGVPAAITACLLVAGSVATLALILEQLVSRRTAVYGAVVAGFGTSLWSVAAAEYFPHAADVFWLLLGVFMLVRRRDWLAGFALAAAITTRPHLAVVALLLGISVGWARRSVWPIAAVGIPATSGLVLVMLYNRWVFGRLNLQGGYGDYVSHPLSGELPGSSGPWFFENIVGSLVSGPRGLMVLTPVLVCLLPGIPRAWRLSPWWVKSAAASGTCYMVVQWQIQDGKEGFLGGYLFYSYRYSIEWLILAVPLFAISYREFVQGRPRRELVTLSTAFISIWIHGVGAVFYDMTENYPFHPWLAWSPLATLWGSPLAQVSIALAVLVALVALPPILTKERTSDSLDTAPLRR